MPRVTVIIPTYNWSTVLPHSIGSVLGQTFTDFELLVIGDGCTDDSEEVVRAIGDPRVQWINIPRTGHQSGPNNEGLRRARGEFIAYLGHDDLWMPQHLALHVARECDFSCSIAALISPDSVDRTHPDAAFTRWVPPSSFVHRRSLGIEWRDYRELSVPPESDLVRRIVQSGARTEVVPRLTVLKFPASVRRNVYRERPSHEQAAWLARVRGERDLEAALLGELLLHRAPHRLWRFLREPSQWWPYIWRRGGNRIRAVKRFKGVD
ncbi:MAG TPA: glycosyltransferase family A protein [Thermoanaerobaculia bacterium]|nr:glycosyltransferase family A protein [Thermoanaerobaculia bacterium]